MNLAQALRLYDWRLDPERIASSPEAPPGWVYSPSPLRLHIRGVTPRLQTVVPEITRSNRGGDRRSGHYTRKLEPGTLMHAIVKRLAEKTWNGGDLRRDLGGNISVSGTLSSLRLSGIVYQEANGGKYGLTEAGRKLWGRANAQT